MARYYYSYRYLALRDGSGRFAAVTRQIERNARAQLSGELVTLLTEPELLRAPPADEALPTDYAKVFSYSNLARIRRGTASGTILAGNTTLFSFRKGNAALEAVRLASAFFGKGQFITTISWCATAFTFSGRKLEGPYYQPLSARRSRTASMCVWRRTARLPRQSLRPRPEQRPELRRRRRNHRARRKNSRSRFPSPARPTCPSRSKLAFRAGGTLRGVEAVAKIPDAFLLASGNGTYAVGDDTITFGPGQPRTATRRSVARFRSGKAKRFT